MYHSVYETFHYVKRFIDPTFTYHQAASRFVTELTRSLSDSVIVPFVTNDYAVQLMKFFEYIAYDGQESLERKELYLGEY